MFEIYLERLHDLLSPTRNSNLRVRSTPERTWVEGLVTREVDSFKAIDSAMEAGNSARTVAATQMNATSSRGHRFRPSSSGLFKSHKQHVRPAQAGHGHFAYRDRALHDLEVDENQVQ